MYKTDTQSDKHIDTWTSKQTDSETDRQIVIVRQIYRETDKP